MSDQIASSIQQSKNDLLAALHGYAANFKYYEDIKDSLNWAKGHNLALHIFGYAFRLALWGVLTCLVVGPIILATINSFVIDNLPDSIKPIFRGLEPDGIPYLFAAIAFLLSLFGLKKRISILKLANNIKRNAPIILTSKEYNDCYSDPVMLSLLSSKYAYSSAVLHFIDYLSSGRSDTLKEAKNLYEQELANAKIQNAIESMKKEIQEAKAQAAYAEYVARNNRR